MAIYRALLFYGFSKFSLDIIKYCKIENLLKMEQFYLDLLKPEYNILQIAGSSLGVIRSEETRAKMSARARLKKVKIIRYLVKIN